MGRILFLFICSISSYSYADSYAFSLPNEKVIHEKIDANFWMIDSTVKSSREFESPIMPVTTAKDCDISLGDCLNQKQKKDNVAKLPEKNFVVNNVDSKIKINQNIEKKDGLVNTNKTVAMPPPPVLVQKKIEVKSVNVEPGAPSR